MQANISASTECVRTFNYARGRGVLLRRAAKVPRARMRERARELKNTSSVSRLDANVFIIHILRIPPRLRRRSALPSKFLRARRTCAISPDSAAQAHVRVSSALSHADHVWPGIWTSYGTRLRSSSCASSCATTPRRAWWAAAHARAVRADTPPPPARPDPVCDHAPLLPPTL